MFYRTFSLHLTSCPSYLPVLVPELSLSERNRAATTLVWMEMYELHCYFEAQTQHIWCIKGLRVCEMHQLSLMSSVQHLFPEKLSRCQWLPIMSEAVVKCPCVRLPLATITTAVIIVLAVFNLVRFYTRCQEKRHTHTRTHSYIHIYVCVYIYVCVSVRI